MPWRTSLPLAAILALSAPLSSGCVERALVVRSDPPGATVFVDGREIGTTPARLPFEHYGTREVMVRMERRDPGADHIPLAPVTQMVELGAPWYQWFPVDFVSEFLWPGTIVDERVVEVALVPHTQAELRERFETSARERGIRPPLDPPTPAPAGQGAADPAAPAAGAPPERP
jgi:hypothetical protein